jgi:23S rRNA (uracil1939-C5)-methyltransferase
VLLRMHETVVEIEKLVHGGQGLARLEDGRKVFVWNALPGERVKIRLIKSKKDYAEGIAEEITKPSSDRIEPEEVNYLATSPWQIMTFKAENTYKKQIVQEIFYREHVVIPEFDFIAVPPEYRYRNKMEYSFWGDEEGLHLALHQRGSRGKQIVSGSKLAIPAVDKGANALLAELQKYSIRAGALKTVIVRTNQEGEAVASLFVKQEEFEHIALPSELKGLRVYYSNPKSPASVPTKLLQEQGDVILADTIGDATLMYDVDSFFQVNVPIFNEVIKTIKLYAGNTSVVDMYGGVGSIGLGIGANDCTIVELDDATVAMAKRNAQQYSARVVQASTEKALDYISQDKVLIVDPPRAGLHKDVTTHINTVKPKTIVYLSCNPATQARDLKLLEQNYIVNHFAGYNFFPRTPHIETLAILQQKP